MLKKRTFTGDEINTETGSLSSEFIIPPFTVFDGRQGYWNKRKRDWINLGIRGDLGRGGIDEQGEDNQFGRAYSRDIMREGAYSRDMPLPPINKVGVLHKSPTGTEGNYIGGDAWVSAGTSVFDPVLTEICYRWFCPKGGSILDPFGGGSTRGLVATALGYEYVGIEIREEQISINEIQAKRMGLNPVWICGDSGDIEKLIPVDKFNLKFDMLFTCPPYYNLEVYSDDDEDASTIHDYESFINWYANLFSKCINLLADDRFVVLVVGELRDKETGLYYNFVGDTARIMMDLGLKYYNEAILITPIGSLPIRTGKQFRRNRKLGKGHQNVLFFFKGNLKSIPDIYGNNI